MMNEAYDVILLSEKIKLLRKAVRELKNMPAGFPALERNVARISAAVRVLELDVVDVLDILYPDTLIEDATVSAVDAAEVV